MSLYPLIVMPIPYAETIFIAFFSKWNFFPCNKCSRVIYGYIWFYKGDITIFIRIIFTELIHIVSFRTFSMVESLVKIPSPNAMLSSICRLNANGIFAEIFE